MVSLLRRARPLPLLAALAFVGWLPVPAVAQEVGLEAALRSALRLHPAVNGKQAQVDAKTYGSDAVRSLRFPTLSVQAQQYGSAPRNSTGISGSSLPVTLRARQPVWAFGRIDSQIAYADADAQAERADLRRVQRQLLENTALTYAAVLSSRQRLQLASSHSQSLQRLHEQILRREQGQLASRADANLAATRLAQARARQQRYEGELEVALSDLLALTLQPVVAEQPVPPQFTALPGTDRVLELALAHSAELGHKQLLVERARAAVAQVKTAAMPTVYVQAERLQGQAGYRNESRMSVVLEGSLEGMGFATRGRTEAAQAELGAAEQDLLSARNDTSRSVRRLSSNLQMLQAMITTQAASLVDLAALLESYKRQYEAGTKSWLDLLNTQRELNEQQLQQVQAESDWLTQSLQLTSLIGGFDTLIASSNGNDTMNNKGGKDE